MSGIAPVGAAAGGSADTNDTPAGLGLGMGALPPPPKGTRYVKVHTDADAQKAAGGGGKALTGKQAAATQQQGQQQVDISRWVCVYPAYLNSKLTAKEGRRISKALAVEDPQPMEMAECVIQGLKLRAALENKGYSRDILQRGRLRVELFDEGTKNPKNAEIASRDALFKAICKFIPLRRRKVEQLKAEQEAAEAKKSAGSKGGKANKKGKKKK